MAMKTPLSAGGNPLARASLGRCLELAIWLGLAGFALYMSFGFDREISGYRYTAASWPRLVFILLAVVAIVQFVLNARDDGVTVSRSGDGEEGDSSPAGGLPWHLAMLPFVYLFLLPRTGFLLTTPVFVVALIWAMGERRITRIVLVTALIIGIVFLVFVRFFYIPLPIGNWPVFYDINTWLLVRLR